MWAKLLSFLPSKLGMEEIAMIVMLIAYALIKFDNISLESSLEEATAKVNELVMQNNVLTIEVSNLSGITVLQEKQLQLYNSEANSVDTLLKQCNDSKTLLHQRYQQIDTNFKTQEAGNVQIAEGAESTTIDFINNLFTSIE